MTISTSIDFPLTRANIVEEALELLGILGEGEAANSAQCASSSRTLNIMVKAWQAEGLNLYSVQEIYLFPSLNTNKYLTSTWNATTSYTKTELSAESAATDTTLTVDSITGISDTNIIGVELDSGDWHWTTVSGAPSGTTVTLAAGIPAGENAAIDNYVVAFASRANRPMKLVNVLRRDLEADSDTPVDLITRERYLALSPKTTNGNVTQIYYNPQISAGVLYTWPEMDSIRKILVLYVQKTLADLDSASDNPEIPQEWFLALTYNLAELLIPKYGVDTKRAQLIMKNAGYYKALAESFDTEDTMQIVPERRY